MTPFFEIKIFFVHFAVSLALFCFIKPEACGVRICQLLSEIRCMKKIVDFISDVPSALAIKSSQAWSMCTETAIRRPAAQTRSFFTHPIFGVKSRLFFGVFSGVFLFFRVSTPTKCRCRKPVPPFNWLLATFKMLLSLMRMMSRCLSSSFQACRPRVGRQPSTCRPGSLTC